MIKNRPVALIVILLIYILAAACGYLAFKFFELNFSLWLSLLLAARQE